ncbi:MAG: hypothetical protein ABIO72_00955 [Patescibacteria group bacterium]
MSLSNGIIGHAAQLRLLEAALPHPAPGYLFVGPRHLGKRTIAERFATSLLGLEGTKLPNVHPDLIRLVPEEGKVQVSVEIVRDARVRLSERPLVGPRIVAFIPELERLNEEGMNALLKVLEEPPAGAVFVCVAESLARIPATIKSRLVILPFSSVSRSEMEAGGINGSRIESSRGRPGLAIEPVEQDVISPQRFVSAKTTGERLAIIDALAKVCDSSDNGVDAWNEALDVWAECSRVALMSQPVIAYVTGSAIIAARGMVGSALSPRLALDAAAIRLASPDPLSNLFPSHLPRAFHPIFLTHS